MRWKIYLLTLMGIFLLSCYLISYSNGNFILNYDTKIKQNQDDRWMGEIYYNNNNMYTPSKRKEVRYKKLLNTFQKIKIKINNIHTLTHIRLDPLLSNGLIEIKNFTVTYLNQMYNIDFSKINPNSGHNIRIIKQTKYGMLLQCTGNDPFIELSNTVEFNTLNLQNILSALTYTFVIYLFFILVVYFLKKDQIQELILFSILTVYTLYTLLFVSPTIASKLLLLFSVASVLATIYTKPSNVIEYIKKIGVFAFLYFLMGYASLYITTDLANSSYFYEKISYIFLALLIPIGFYNLKHFNLHFFKVVLSMLLLTMAIFIILLDHNIISISGTQVFSLSMERIKWTQKNYMFWYVLLMFGTLSFYSLRNKKDFITVVLLLMLSYYTVFHGYSSSARLAFGGGVLLYTILSLFQIKKKYLLIIIWVLTLYIIFSPLLFSLVDLTAYHHKLIQRDAIYHTAAALIKEHWLFGYGFGSTLSMHLQDFVLASEIPKHHLNVFPGGHPHNLSLLFWLEFGIFGALFLAYYIHKLLLVFIEKTYNQTNFPALFGMIVAFDIITSFSWSIWYPQVLLTFSFFGLMLVLSMNINIQQDQGTK